MNANGKGWQDAYNERYFKFTAQLKWWRERELDENRTVAMHRELYNQTLKGSGRPPRQRAVERQAALLKDKEKEKSDSYKELMQGQMQEHISLKKRMAGIEKEKAQLEMKELAFQNRMALVRTRVS